MNRDGLISIINTHIMTPTEVVAYLGISKQRLSDMNRSGKLKAIKKGIYLRMDVEQRKAEQDTLRLKYAPKPVHK